MAALTGPGLQDAHHSGDLRHEGTGSKPHIIFLSFIYPSSLSLLHSSFPPCIYSCFHPFFPSIHPSSFHPFYLPLSYPFIPPPSIYILFFSSSIFSFISLSIQSFYVPFFHPSTLPLFLYYIHPSSPPCIYPYFHPSFHLSIDHPSTKNSLFPSINSFSILPSIFQLNLHLLSKCPPFMHFFLFSILPSIHHFFINPFYLLLFNHISIQPFFVIFIHKYILPSITFFCSHSNFLSSSILYTPSFCLLSYQFYHLFIFFHSAFLLSCIILCSFLSLFSILFFSSSIHSLCLPFFYLSIHFIWHSVHSIWLFHPSLHLRKTQFLDKILTVSFSENVIVYIVLFCTVVSCVPPGALWPLHPKYGCGSDCRQTAWCGYGAARILPPWLGNLQRLVLTWSGLHHPRPLCHGGRSRMSR